MISASAPGKLVILGEYGVLESGPALVMATNRRVHVTIDHCGGDTLKITVLPLLDTTVDISVASNQVSVPAPMRDSLSLILGILEQLQGSGVLSLSALAGKHISVDSRALYTADGHKLGLGSSAAVTVALAGALFALGANDQPDFPTLFDLHRSFQGSGSGLDVASSFCGGLMRFQKDPASKPTIAALELPGKISLQPIWSGESASTGAFLQRLHTFSGANPEAYMALMQRLKEIAHAGIEHVRRLESKDLVTSVREFGMTLKALGDAAAIPIFSSVHREIEAHLVSDTVAYKPCGAGGGDLGLALSCDAAELSAACSVLPPPQILDLAMDTQGLMVRAGL